MSEPKISVVVPVLNEARRIEGCLDALAAQRDAPAFEVIVVDNGSHDATRELARDHAIGARLAIEGARGPYAARNAGMSLARSEIIAFTDGDCLPRPGWLAAGVKALDDGADLAGGRIVQMPSERPTVWERYDRATYLRQDRFIDYDGFAATANLFVRTNVVRDVGGFVPQLTASGDQEFCRRATAAGYRLAYQPDAVVDHHPRTTMRDTWALHRKLGMGFSELARFGVRGSPWNDLSLRTPLGVAVADVEADGGRVRIRRLAPVHYFAMAARWVGRLTGRD
jgi:glycosyltransferase involved in cell wall biosynthesis